MGTAWSHDTLLSFCLRCLWWWPHWRFDLVVNLFFLCPGLCVTIGLTKSMYLLCVRTTVVCLFLPAFWASCYEGDDIAQTNSLKFPFILLQWSLMFWLVKRPILTHFPVRRSFLVAKVFSAELVFLSIKVTSRWCRMPTWAWALPFFVEHYLCCEALNKCFKSMVLERVYCTCSPCLWLSALVFPAVPTAQDSRLISSDALVDVLK